MFLPLMTLMRHSRSINTKRAVIIALSASVYCTIVVQVRLRRTKANTHINLFFFFFKIQFLSFICNSLTLKSRTITEKVLYIKKESNTAHLITEQYFLHGPTVYYCALMIIKIKINYCSGLFSFTDLKKTIWYKHKFVHQYLKSQSIF